MTNKKFNLFNFIIIFLIIITVGALCLRLFFADRKNFSFFGYSCFVLSSDSMSPLYPKDSLIIVKSSPFSDLKVNDIIVYKSDALGGKPAFHRVLRVEDDGVYTKGDNNDFEDNQLITVDSYIGNMVFSNYLLGVYLSRLFSPLGFVCFFLLPVLLVYFIAALIKRLINLSKID